MKSKNTAETNETFDKRKSMSDTKRQFSVTKSLHLNN